MPSEIVTSHSNLTKTLMPALILNPISTRSEVRKWSASMGIAT